MVDAARPIIEEWVKKPWPRDLLIEHLKHYCYAEYRSSISNAKHFINTPMERWELKLYLAKQAV